MLSQIMQMCLRVEVARSSFFEKHVLMQWSVKTVPDWVDKHVCTLIQQRVRFCGNCAFLMVRGTMMTLCRERKKQEAGSLLCKRLYGLMTFPLCVFAQQHLVWFKVPLLFLRI